MTTIERVKLLKSIPETKRMLEKELLAANEGEHKKIILELSERMLKECSLFQGFSHD